MSVPDNSKNSAAAAHRLASTERPGHRGRVRIDVGQPFAQSLLHSQVEASLDGMLLVDPEGRVLMYNRRFVELWQVCAEIIDSASDRDLLAAVSESVVDTDEFAARIEHLYAHPEATSREQVRLRDGRTFDRYSAPARGRDGAIFGRAWFFRDITVELHKQQRVQAQAAELEAKTAELQHAVRARDEFLSVASHELKTPVTALHLQIQNILRAAQRDDAKVSRDWLLTKVKRSEAQLLRLSRLIDNLLDVSRIAAGRLEFEYEDLDLGQVAIETAERLRDDAAKVGSTIAVEAAPKLVGTCDRLRLEQVFTNLITNAIKYGSGRPIVCAVRAQGGKVELAVTDQGIGISEANQQRIFERFERAVSEREYGGLGLGLWITRQIVEALHGQIRVQSTAGVGSCFTVTLPLRPHPDADSSDCPPRRADDRD